ncbi:MAG: molybdopterin-binding protein, partial [Planctomycetota bacterium]
MSDASSPIRAAVLTVSDRCSRGEATDTSGPAVAAMLRDRLGATIVATQCLPDEMDALAACFMEWSRPGAGIDL